APADQASDARRVRRPGSSGAAAPWRPAGPAPAERAPGDPSGGRPRPAVRGARGNVGGAGRVSGSSESSLWGKQDGDADRWLRSYDTGIGDPGRGSRVERTLEGQITPVVEQDEPHELDVGVRRPDRPDRNGGRFVERIAVRARRDGRERYRPGTHLVRDVERLGVA